MSQDTVKKKTYQTKCTVTAICNRKGGVGKSAVAINMARSLSQAKYRVLFLDLDPQADSTSLLCSKDPEEYREEGKTIVDLLLRKDAFWMEFVVPTKYSDISIIPSHSDLQDTAILKARYHLPTLSLASRITHETLDGRYDYVMIDCPPNFEYFSELALAMSDFYLIPIHSGSKFALYGLKRLLDQVDDLRIEANPQLRALGIVENHYDARTMVCKEIDRQLRLGYGNAVFKTQITNSTVQQQAEVLSAPVMDHAPTGKLAGKYRLLRDEFLERVASGGLIIRGGGDGQKIAR